MLLFCGSIVYRKNGMFRENISHTHLHRDIPTIPSPKKREEKKGKKKRTCNSVLSFKDTFGMCAFFLFASVSACIVVFDIYRLRGQIFMDILIKIKIHCELLDKGSIWTASRQGDF